MTKKYNPLQNILWSEQRIPAFNFRYIYTPNIYWSIEKKIVQLWRHKDLIF